MVSPGLRGCVLQKESKPSSTLLYTLTSLSTCENEGKVVTHKQITHRLGHTPYPRVETIVRAGLWGRWRNHKELVTSARVHFTPWALTLTSCVRFQVYFPGSKWAPAKEFFHVHARLLWECIPPLPGAQQKILLQGTGAYLWIGNTPFTPN